MLRRAVIAALACSACGGATAAAAPHVTFTKWSVQISYAGVVENDSHPPGEPQPVCEDDQLSFAGVAGRYHGFPEGATVTGVFFLDGHKVATAGPYTTGTKGTFGLSWQPKPAVPINGPHDLELRFKLGRQVITRTHLRFVPGGVDDCG